MLYDFNADNENNSLAAKEFPGRWSSLPRMVLSVLSASNGNIRKLEGYASVVCARPW